MLRKRKDDRRFRLVAIRYELGRLTLTLQADGRRADAELQAQMQRTVSRGDLLQIKIERDFSGNYWPRRPGALPDSFRARGVALEWEPDRIRIDVLVEESSLSLVLEIGRELYLCSLEIVAEGHDGKSARGSA